MAGKKVGWVLSNGIIGMDNQSMGLAAALGLNVTKKHLIATTPWRYLPPQLWINPLRFLGKGSDPLTPPWPDVVISTGRLTVAPALAIKRASGGKVFNIRIQSAYTAYDEFDVIVHEETKGFQQNGMEARKTSFHEIKNQETIKKRRKSKL